ncbi:restriction endonuclease subunit S [Mycobacterium asiaticum]|uniref:Restriction endonuclease subunit S n=1 Tax=Mycobacterium asiaticum TaxID=1790 RepID=A0A1A3CDA1_MYCAS|nr:restriction endonuclease subunit S [Mycobacterium asiaticum]OBI84658.1 restriction endonuclease subunit S [Mycobacterium asiaticum]
MNAVLGDYLDFRAGDISPAREAGGRYPVYGANGVIGHTSERNARGPLIVIGRVGSFCGSLHYCHGDAWVSDNALVCRPDDPEETRYWYYALQHCGLNRFRAGSGQPLLNQGILRNVPIRVADKAERALIGTTLAALDDKVAANNRMIASAEVLMTTLVEQVAERVRLSDLAQRAATCAEPRDMHGVVAHYSFPAFDRAAQPNLVDSNKIKSAKFVLTEPCVLFSKMNPRIPRIWNVPQLPLATALASTEFVVLRPIGVDTSVLWSALRQPDVSAALQRMSAGMTGSRQRIQPRQLLDVMVRDVRCLDARSAQTITELGALCERRRAESAALASVRDQVLPLLMSGRVRSADTVDCRVAATTTIRRSGSSTRK